MRGAWLIFKKEMLELSKDRKTLFFTLVLPILIYPVLFLMMGKMAQRDEQQRQGKPSRVVLMDASNVLKPLLAAEPKLFELVNQPLDKATQAIKERTLELAVEVDAEAADKLAAQRTFTLKVSQDTTEDASRLALKRLRDLLQKQDERWVKARLQALVPAGATEETARPSRLETTDLGDAGRVAAKIVGSVVPFLMVLMMLTGAMQPGIYVTAGERERGTLQTLLATSIPRLQIILGKLFYIFAIGIMAALANLLSVSLSLVKMASGFGPPAAAGAPKASSMMGLAALTDPVTILLAFLLLVPLGLFFANVILYLGIQAKNSQEAGTSILPFMLAILFLGYFSIAPGAEKLTYLTYLPVVNVSMMLRKMIGGQLVVVEYLVTLAMTVGLAGMMSLLSVRRLNQDDAIFKNS